MLLFALSSPFPSSLVVFFQTISFFLDRKGNIIKKRKRTIEMGRIETISDGNKTKFTARITESSHGITSWFPVILIAFSFALWNIFDVGQLNFDSC